MDDWWSKFLTTIVVGFVLICVLKWIYGSFGRSPPSTSRPKDEDSMRRRRLRHFERKFRQTEQEKNNVTTEEEKQVTEPKKERETRQRNNEREKSFEEKDDVTANDADDRDKKSLSTKELTSLQSKGHNLPPGILIDDASPPGLSTETTLNEELHSSTTDFRPIVTKQGTTPSPPPSPPTLNTHTTSMTRPAEIRSDKDKDNQWYEIDRRTDVRFEKRFQKKMFTITTSERKIFREYRLRILCTRKVDSNMCQMSRFEIFLDDGHVHEIVANDENAPSETADKLLDPDQNTKWLCRRRHRRRHSSPSYWMSHFVRGVVRVSCLEAVSIERINRTSSIFLGYGHRPTRSIVSLNLIQLTHSQKNHENTRTPTLEHRYTPRVVATKMMKRRLLTGFPVSLLGRVQVLRNML